MATEPNKSLINRSGVVDSPYRSTLDPHANGSVMVDSQPYMSTLDSKGSLINRSGIVDSPYRSTLDPKDPLSLENLGRPQGHIDTIRKEEWLTAEEMGELAERPSTRDPQSHPASPAIPLPINRPTDGKGAIGGMPTDGSTAVSPADTQVRDIITGMLTNPTGHIVDNKLLQQYTEQQLTPEELQDPDKYQVGDQDAASVATAKGPSKVTAGTGTAAQSQVAADVQAKLNFEAALIDPNSLTKAINEVNKLDPMKAASMADQLDSLLEGMSDGNVPLWARPAVAQVEQMLASRGLSASSIGRDSLFNAIIQAAMPIAQQDATFLHDSYKTEYTSKVQAVLSDVNMEFAAKQFNASSINQTNQFRAQLQTQVDLQNAARKDAMAQFNASEANRMEQFNIGNELQTAQFNAQLESSTGQFNASQVNSMTQMVTQLQAQREQFNSQMSSQIEQSNVSWRRQVNQANTAGINAVNQANVQNAFNLSNQALTFLWQEMRDNAHWDFQASQSEKDRKAQLEVTLLANETAMGGEIGRTIENLLNGSKLLDGLFDLWGK